MRRRGDDGSLLAPTLGTILFVIVVPGAVVVWVPYELSAEWTSSEPFLGLAAMRWLGILLGVAALPIFVDFLVRFVREGIGTPAPVAPPRRLVVAGTFRYCRNPGYVAVIAMVVGQGLWLGSGSILIYAVSLWVAFHLFVVLYEEPDLRRRFGTDYDGYCASVPRWIPRGVAR